MDDLDVDFDILDDDPIKKFLLHKLDEIKLHNSSLEQQLKNRKQAITGCIENMALKFSENLLEYDGNWQRILNDKWIIGINVKIINNIRTAKNINIILNTNPSTPFIYNTKIFTRYKTPVKDEPTLPDDLKQLIDVLETNSNKNRSYLENEWISVTDICQNSTIMIAFQAPDFLENHQYDIQGVLSYECRGRKCQLLIPDIKISAGNLTDPLYTVQNHSVLTAKDEDFLSVLIANEIFELVAMQPEGSYRNLDKNFEFECGFKRVSAVSETRKFFYVDGLSSSLNGAMMALQKDEESARIYNLSVFCGNQAQLCALLHFIHQNVAGVVILPCYLKGCLIENSGSDHELQVQSEVSFAMKDTMKEFSKSLESQIQQISQFYNEQLRKNSSDVQEGSELLDLQVDGEEYKDFRSKLADFEEKSALMFAKVEKFVKNPEVLLENVENDSDDVSI